MMQITELHFRSRPAGDYSAVKTRAQELLATELDSSDPREAAKAFLIVHENQLVEYADGKTPAETAIFGTDQPPQIESYQQDPAIVVHCAFIVGKPS